ncbi:MAG: outer membrane beta-barrel protein [Bacteroidota bacterium]
MKKISLVVFVCMTVLVAQAQTVAKTKMLGGGILYSSSKQTDYMDATTKQSEYSIIPSFGYFVKDKIAVGVNVGYVGGKSEGGFSNTVKESGFVAGPFVRAYAHTSNNSLAVYGQFSVLLGSGKRTTESGAASTDIKNSDLDIALAPGLAYFFNQHWAFELGFRGISYAKNDPNKDLDNDEVSSFAIGLNSLLPSTLGFRYHF